MLRNRVREMSILKIKKWAFTLNLKPQQRGLWSAILGTASLIETTKIDDYRLRIAVEGPLSISTDFKPF